ncbi:MAG: glycerol acyltransferase [Saprospiraceae bacterium]|nr:MAG: glycerol acyltransferase [Saprospiraceae bacterium]
MELEKLEKALQEKNVEVEVPESDLAYLRKPGPYVCVANTALSDVDDMVLMYLFERAGVEGRILSRKQKAPEDFHQHYLPVKYNLLQGDQYVNEVFKVLRKCREQGMNTALSLNFSDTRMDALLRQRLFKRLMKALLKLKVPIIPVRIQAPFPGFVQPGLGARLVQRKREEPYRIDVRIGAPIGVEEQALFAKPARFRRYLQSRIYCLGTRLELRKVFFNPLSSGEGQTAPLAEPIPAEVISSEIEKLHFGNLIASQGDFDIYVATAAEIPESLKEIGRLRELTFRAVGEGTGKARDLDEFDVYYRQLILWNRKDKRIAGGYRMGLGDEIFARYGPDGFYVSSLFKVKPCFHPVMQKAVELGRSYVVPDYQRQRLPLFLLWKGILHFLLQNPHYRYLYGPVSISKYYSNISRSLIVAFIEKHYFNHELAACLKPRKPFRFKPDKVDVDLLTEGLSDNIQSLDNLIETIEPEHIRLPVLVRQYLKLNARFISFNVDPNFSDVLDGFIILDLQDVPVEMIEALKREGQ